MNPSKTLTLISKLAFFIFFLFSLNVQAQNLNQLSREEYTDYLNNHPFMKRKRMTKEELKKIPKNDRPDLAWEYDYLTTLDPATGKPERSRLFPTLDYVDQMQAIQTPVAPGSSPSAAWVERGPNNVGGRTRALMWDPNDPTGKKVWAGGVTGGLWYNNDITNANSQWQRVNDFWDNIAISCIAYDPNDPDTMYVGTGESYGSNSTTRGAGIWRSTNGGNTWTRLSSTTNFYYVNDIVVRNENGNSVVYAAVDGNYYNGVWHGAAQAGLQRSTNDGSTWSQVLPSIPSNSPNYVANDIEIGPNNRLWIGTIATPYAATDRGGGRVLYSDNGTSWTTAYSHSVTNGYGRVEVAVAPSNASYVYAVIEDQNVVDGIVRTTNGGSTWSNLSEPNDADLGIPATDFSRGQAWYNLIAAVDPSNPNSVIVGGINLHRSTNGGTSWSQISKWSNNPNMGTQPYSLVHADQHNILYKPGSSSELIFGNDGGVYWTNNISSAATSSVISDRNNGYNVTQYYAGAIHPSSGSNVMIGGTQDNGSHLLNSTGLGSGTEISGGDGAFCFIDQTNGLDMVTSYVYNRYYLHNSTGAYVRTILNDNNSGSFINPADLDDANNILYTAKGNGEIYKVTNYNTTSYNGGTISISGISGLAMPTAIKVSPYNNSANVYVGDMSGNLVKINNANGSSPTFSNLTPPNFPNGAISSIEFGSSENEILVTFKNYGVISIFYSTNGGTSWSINKDGNLPDMPVRWALMNPNNNNEVILATEVGVWATTNFQASSPSWVPSNSGLANVRVDMLQYRASDNTVMAITHGRGVFTSNAWNQSTPTTPTGPYRTLAILSTVDANGVADSNGVTCETAGIVASPNFSTSGAPGPDVSFSVINSSNTAGITAISFADAATLGYTPQIGDSVYMFGTVSQFNGLNQFDLDSIQVKSTGNQLPWETFNTTLGESDESRLIRLDNVSLVTPSQWPAVGADANVDIEYNGTTYQMRIDRHTNIAQNLSAPTGRFNVVGIGGQFDGTSPYTDGYQIFPRFSADITPLNAVTFRVDMSNVSVNPAGVHVAGEFRDHNADGYPENFNNAQWTSNANPMTQDPNNPNIYSTTIWVQSDSLEYKFLNGNQWGQDEQLSVGSSCTKTTGQFTNRISNINSDVILPIVCFQTCGSCAQSDTLYSFDFANGLPTGWTNIGDTSTALWEYRGPNTTPSNSIGSRGAFSGGQLPINSETSSNGFMIFDSDYLDDPLGASGNGTSPAPHIGSVRTQTLNFANEQNVILQFESYYRKYQSRVGVAISTNGGNTYPDTVFVHEFLPVNQATSTSDLIRLDISSYVGGQSNVKLAFVFDGSLCNQFGCGYYFWMIDDVKLLRTPANDINLFEAYHTVGNFIGRYGSLPKGINPPITFWGNTVNEGTASQTNARVTFSGGNLNYTSPSLTLAPDSFMLFSSNTTFVPFQSGSYTFTANAVSDFVDGYPFNNSIQFGFDVTDSTYNLSRGINNEFLGTNSWANASDTFIVANILELTDSVEVNSVGVHLSAASTPGGKIWIRVWDYNSTIRGAGGSFQNPQAPQSAMYTLTASDISNGYVQIPIQGTGNSKKLLPGSYYVGAVLFGNNNADTVRIPSDNSVFQPFDAAVIYIPMSSGFGGVYTNGNAFNMDVNVAPINPATLPPLPQANGDTLYKYDFNSGLPTAWVNQGDTSTSLWEYRGPNTTPSNTVGSRGPFAGSQPPINSQTRGNGFMIFDSDYLDDPFGASGTGQSPAPHVGVLYTEGLNFGNNQNVTIQLNSFFRTFESAAGIAFSTNGGLTYPDTIYLHQNLASNQSTANSEVVRLDVSNYIGGQPNVKIAFIFDGRNPLGLNGGLQRSYYFWQIDDISFQTSPSVDLQPLEIVVKNPNAIGQHAAIPSFLYQDFDLDARVTNKGAKTATSVDVFCKTDAASNTFIPDFPSGPIAALNSDDTSGVLSFAPLYSTFFGGIDTYYLTFYPRSDSAEGYSANDTIYRQFEVTNNEYRLHTNNWNASIGTNFNVAIGTADSIEIINEFYFSNSAVIDTITIGLGGATRVGAVAIPLVYNGTLSSGLNLDLLGQPYTITATDTINGFAKIPVNHTVNSGPHYIGVMLNSNNTASHITIRDDLSIPQHLDAALFGINGVLYSNGNAFHITLNVNQPPSLAQIDLPITWDDSLNVDYTVIDFGGNASGTMPDPANPGNRILRSDKTAGAQTWAGTVLGTVNGLATNIPFAQGATSISAVVFSPDSGIAVRLKTEDTLNPTISVETELFTTKANAWDTLVFDFANNVPNTPAINFNNTYNQLVIFYDFGTSPTTTKTYYLDDVYFGGTPPPTTYNITFQVDMQNVLQSYTTPELNGTFNNWCGNCMQMSDANNDSIWDITIQLQAGTYEYKFAADNWAIDEILTQGSFCTVTNGGFTNRVLTVTGDTVLPAVCWASCNTCSPPPPTYNVTFQVDMNNVTQPFNTPEVNGTFNSWCGNCNAMSDSNNDGIWDVTLTLPADTFEFKYSADSWTIQEQLTPGLSCVVTNFGFTNRYLVITGDTTLPVVCWESCQACPPPCPGIGQIANVTHINCFGDSSGAITVSAFGGNDPYTYDWGFAQGATITGLQAGWYQVTVTDSSNCVDSSWIQVFQPTLPLTAETDGPLAIFEVTNPNGSNFLMDFGAMDATTWGTNLDISSTSGQLVVAVDSTGDSLLCGSGIANASAINGNIAVAYRGGCEFGLKALRAQQAGATGLVLINNVPNNVNLGGGAFGNQVNIPVVLLNPQNGQILRNLMKQGATVYFGADTLTPIEPTCNGNTNGELSLNVFGGTSPYTYAWSNNQGGRVNSGLGSGVYAVTVTDNNGCTTVDSVTLNQPNTLSIALANATNPTSPSATNGSISVSVTGGTPPYSGSWNTNPVQTGLQANNLGVGSYTVNITDSNGCTGIFSYGLCVDDTSSSSVAICQGDSALIFGNFETNGGFYYQTYQTSSGCDSVIEVELVVNSNPVILGVTVNQVTGCGTNDGSISLQGISANSSSITYALNTGQSQVNNGVFTGLFPATYDVTVTDSLGCSNNTGPLVINPFAGSPGQPTVSGNTSFQYCVGDPIQTITATGGAGMLYWYDNANLATPIDSGSSFTPPNVVGFNAYYVAEVASGCQGPPTQIFVEISPVPPVPVLTGAGTYCDVQSVNPVFAQGVGVIWYGDSALSVQVGSGSQLAIGVFANVGVTNAYATSNSNGCTSASASISVTVLPPVPAPTVSNVAYCDNESAIGFNANILSGNSPRWYSDAGLNNLVSVNPQFTPSTSIGTSTFYLTQFDGTCESPAVTASSTVYQSPVINSVFTNDVSVCGATDGSLSINASVNNIGPKYSIDNGVSYQPTSSFSNLAAAGYIIVVADTFCSTTYGIATIAAPGAPAAPNVSGNDTICDGDSYNGFTATAQGSGDLTWYSSPLLGLNNQVDTGMAFTPSNLNVGVNTYYVTETQGTCEGAASAVSIIVNGLPNVSAGIDQSICDGGSATLVATGAVSYNWVGVGNNDTVIVSPTTQTTYVVIGTSTAGCVASDSMVVSINPLPTVSAGTVAPICIDAGNFILPKGSPNGGQYSGLNVSSNTFLVGQAGIGTHIIYYDYTDANGCSNTDSTFVVVNPLPAVSLGALANICANDAAVALSTGTPINGVYSGPGVSSGSFDPAAAGGAGTYNIVYAFTDTNGCSSSDTNAITVDTVPVISWIAFPTICELDGPYTLVEASPSGGVYSGTGVSSGIFDISTVAIPGSYEITYDFTDGNGCIGTGSQFIDAVNNPVVNLGPDTVLCNNRPSITLDAGAGATFDWILNGTSTGQTSQTITVDSASSGTYVVVVANADGCEGSDTIVVDYTSICVGVETIGNVEGRIAVYPNPTQGIFTLEVTDISALSFEVQIFNTGGQIVYDQTFANTKYVREEIDLSGLSRGIYYINLKTETGLAKYKLILN